MRRMSLAPPNRLVQQCRESNDCCTIECPGITSGGFLTSRGSATGYFYTAQDSILTIYRYGDSLSSAREIYTHNYGKGTVVVSAAHYRLNDDSDDSVLVLVRQAKTVSTSDLTLINCISLKTRKLIKSCVFHGKYNHMEVCIDGRQTAELKKLKDGLQNLENIVVVGGEDTSALLLSLGPIHEDAINVKPTAPVKKICLLRPDGNGLMEYQIDGNYATFAPSSARVESLCYMSQRCSIAIGLSNGVIFFISMKTGRSDSLFLGGSVERMVVQHPLNDTDNSLFLWTTLQHKDTTHLILLSTLPNDSKAQNELLFVPRFSYIPPGSVEFLQFRSVVLSRKQAAALGNSDEANDEESSRDSNSSFSIRESGRFNQLMIFLYTERFNNSFALKGSVFDLDGYYSRRMPREALVDRTPAQQCGFLSHFRLEKPSFEPQETLDFLLADVGRFVPPGSLGALDQHFYPSSLYFSFNLLSDRKGVEIRVPCLQDQVVNDVSKNFLEYYQAPSGITQFLHGVGLCNSLADENESVMRTCLFRVLLHNYYPGCMNFLREKDISDDILNFTHKWLGKEVESTKLRLDEDSKTLFTMKPSDIPRPAILFSEHSQLVFRRVAQLYDLLIDRFQKKNAEEEFMQRLTLNKKICEDLLLQISTILLGSHVDLLRDTPENVERLNKLRLGFAERKLIASRLNIRLEIYKIFQDIIEASRGVEHFNELFGQKQPHELYPPDSFTDLLDVIPHINVNLSAKLQILGYFTKDLDFFSPIKNQQQSTFDMACGFLLNDNLTSEAISEMMTAWNSDMRLLRINKMREVPGMDALKRLSDSVDKSYSEQDLKFMPCTNKEEKDVLLKLYGRFPYGIHKFNLEMIARRRFEMIVDPPAQIHPNEPEEVRRSRNEVARIKRDFSHLFVRSSFNRSILDKCREQQSRPPHMRIEPLDEIPFQIQMDRPSFTQESRFPKASSSTIMLDDDNKTIQRFEAFPPRTPVSVFASRNQSINASLLGADQQLSSTPPTHLNSFGDLLPRLTPPVQRTTSTMQTTPVAGNKSNRDSDVPPSPYISHDASKIVRNSAMKSKEMERLHRLTTPQSIRIRREKHTFSVRTNVTKWKRSADTQQEELLHTPPSSSSPRKAPTSILRDNSNKRPRLAEEQPRNIKFVETQRVLIIPSNHENREAQQAETSFTEFAALNESSTDDVSFIEKVIASSEPNESDRIDEDDMEQVERRFTEYVEEIVIEESEDLDNKQESNGNELSDKQVVNESGLDDDKDLMEDGSLEIIEEVKNNQLVLSTPAPGQNNTQPKGEEIVGRDVVVLNENGEIKDDEVVKEVHQKKEKAPSKKAVEKTPPASPKRTSPRKPEPQLPLKTYSLRRSPRRQIHGTNDGAPLAKKMKPNGKVLEEDGHDEEMLEVPDENDHDEADSTSGKRGRGHRGKVASPVKDEVRRISPRQSPSIKSPALAVVQKETPTKRGSGRSKKTEAPSKRSSSGSPEPSKGEESSSVTKRGRGRPKKAETPTSTVNKSPPRVKTPQPLENLEEDWLRRNIRMTPERKRRAARQKSATPERN